MPYSFYIFKINLIELLAKYNSGQKLMIVTENYGEVIEQGWGPKPPKEVRDKMENEYGPI